MAKAKQTTELKANQFTHKGELYEVILPKVSIPGIGVLTAAEIAVDEDAQFYLVTNGCIGSVITKIYNDKNNG